jgi:hypothetical protein
MRLIIAGSRTIEPSDENLNKVIPWLDKITTGHKVVYILNGCADGADLIGHMYAVLRGIQEVKYAADWELYGKAAGPKRNELMAQNADALALIWDGKSRGSKNMLENARKYNLKIRQLIIKS